VNDPRTPRVLLLTLSQRTSAKGNSYLSGYLGKTSVVGFPGEPDKFGNETWDLFVSPAPPRQQSPAVAVRPSAGHGATALPPGIGRVPSRAFYTRTRDPAPGMADEFSEQYARARAVSKS
jgi:hypothetical protein